MADFLRQTVVLGGYASLQLRQHSFNGGRDCCLDRLLKQRLHLRHDCLHDVGNAGCRDVGRICSDCPLRCTCTCRRRFRSLPCLPWLQQVGLGHNRCLSSDTACAIDLHKGDWAISRKIQVSKVIKSSDV